MYLSDESNGQTEATWAPCIAKLDADPHALNAFKDEANLFMTGSTLIAGITAVFT